MERKELEAKAKELKIKFDENTEDSELEKLIKSEEDRIKKEKEEKEKENSDPDYWKNEAKEAFAKRDEEKKKVRSLTTKIKDLETKLESAPKSEELDDLKKTLKDLKAFKQEKEEEEEAKKLEKASEIEKLEFEFAKKEKDMQSKLDELSEKYEEKINNLTSELDSKSAAISNLRKTTLKSQIIEAATKYKAYNPTQIVGLVKDRFEYDESLDEFSSVEKDEKGKISSIKSIEEVVKAFLNDPINDNLVQADVNSDGIHEEETRFKQKENLQDKDAKKYDPNNATLKREADERRMEVSEWIEIKKKRDEKLAKIEEKRKAA